MKVKAITPRRVVCYLGLLILASALVLVSGCGKKPEPQTDPDLDTSPVVQPIPQPVAPEAPAEPVLDYTAMQPAEYGIEDVFFGFDRYDLDDSALATLTRNARIMREHSDVVILIEGHCDERGTVEYNLALGEKRAKAVRDHLVQLGIPATRLRVTSYGESRPFALGSTEQAWAQNRRAHFARP
jgi:peptidoglycan-associated lipoprotein